MQHGPTHALPEILDLRILEREALQLILDALHLRLLELDALDLDTLARERGHHALLLARAQKQQALASALVARRAADAVYVRLRILGRVDLHDPVDGRKVEPTRGDVGRDEHRVLGRGELLEDLEALVLLLLAM